jgi:hypothetical protein
VLSGAVARVPVRAAAGVIGCCLEVAASLALSIPLDILRIERENRHLRQLALRPEAG